MSFGFFGIQFGFALQTANVSRIFQTLGAEIDKIGYLWAAAPITGLLVQPIIGYFSDRTWHKRWGRRRPYFFLGAVFASIALFLMPQSTTLWMAALLLWVMDATINVSMEPFRAFVGDKLPPTQRTLGFATQTFFIGLGAVIASLLPWILTDFFGVSNEAPEHVIPDSVKYSFIAGAVVFFLSVLWTVISSDEYPPEDLEKWKAEKERTKGFWKGIKEIANGILEMPVTMKQLAVVQFFTWVGFFCMWVYTTPAIAENVYGTIDAQSKEFQDAGNWVGSMFAVYNGVSFLAAFLLPGIANKFSRTGTHLACLALGGLGLISMYFITDKYMLLVPMILVGLAWASTLTIPYAILAGSLPAEKMGFYMGVFNFFIVIPQIVMTFLSGPVLKLFFHNQAVYILVLGGISLIIGGLCNFRVDDKEYKMKIRQ
ncbi:MAG: MFS transporter, partial [Chitinophagaceae bacterium]|nr:MFS transporter [Chitinophagaceae bacterium]